MIKRFHLQYKKIKTKKNILACENCASYNIIILNENYMCENCNLFFAYDKTNFDKIVEYVVIDRNNNNYLIKNLETEENCWVSYENIIAFINQM